MSIIAKCNMQRFTTLTGAMLESALTKRRTGRKLPVWFCTMCSAHHCGKQREVTSVERLTRAAARVLSIMED
jgi:hypothetical protein